MQRLAPHFLTSVGDRFGGNLAENGSYLGIILLATVVIGSIALRRLAVVRVVAAFGVVAFVLSLGSRLAVDGVPSVSATGTTLGVVPLPGAIMDAIPLAKNALPVRYSMYVALAAAFLLAVILQRRAPGRGGSRRARGLGSEETRRHGGPPRPGSCGCRPAAPQRAVRHGHGHAAPVLHLVVRRAHTRRQSGRRLPLLLAVLQRPHPLAGGRLPAISHGGRLLPGAVRTPTEGRAAGRRPRRDRC